MGDFSYYDDAINGPEIFEERNVLYSFDMNKSKLVIGKFCMIAAKTKFMMQGNHKLDAFSTYPFPIFQQGLESVYNPMEIEVKGDISVGNDVWLGYDCLIIAGVNIGDGAIVSSRSVVKSCKSC